MKKFSLVLFFLLIATTSYASHIDWVDVNDKDSVYGQKGMIAYNLLLNESRELMYYESQHSSNSIFGTYSLDQGESVPSLTTIFFDTVIDINSTVPTNNVSGDVSFIFNTSLKVYDMDIKSNVYSGSSSH